MRSKRKIEGTQKFIVYFYNAKNVRAKSTAMPEHFVGKQWGRIFPVDSGGNIIGEGKAFVDYGEMISFINKIVSQSLRKNLKNAGTWRKKVK